MSTRPEMDFASAGTSHLRVALFNDTGRSAHVGCRAVSSGHERMLARVGATVTYRSFLGEWSELWTGNEHSSLDAFHKSPLASILRHVDAVIVNGEGTIHHGKGMHLLTILAGAQQLGLPTLLVNAVFQDCERYLGALRELKDFTVRDARSSNYLKQLNVPHRWKFDSIAEADFSEQSRHDFAGKVVITDWHPERDADVGAVVQRLAAELGSDAIFYPLEAPARLLDWRNSLADLRAARLVVTARHHGVCLAALAGIPFVALGSNTWKVEGLLASLPHDLRVCSDESDLRAMCDEAITNDEQFREIGEFVRAQRPLGTFDSLKQIVGVSRRNTSTPCQSIHSRSAQILGNTSGRARSFPYSGIELEHWLNEQQSVCGERRTLVAGPGATLAVAKLLARGIDAHGVDTIENAPTQMHNGRCIGGSIADLPFDGRPFGSALLLGSLDELDDDGLVNFLSALRPAIEGSLHVRIFNSTFAHRNRAWWEKKFFAAGFRKHPLRHRAQSFDALEQERPLTMYFEALSATGGAYDADHAGYGIDPTRLAGREADSVLARYEIAAGLVRPWDTVLDFGCGSGHGTHLLRRATRGKKFIGLDAETTTVAYANAHFSAPTVQFCCGDPVDALFSLEEASIDCAVCAWPLDEAETVVGLLEAMHRVLAPGGRIVFALSPDVDASAIRQALGSQFIFETVYRQCGDDATHSPRLLERTSLDQFATPSADAWVLVAMKNPLAKPLPAYRETAFSHVAAGTHAATLSYPQFYENAWLLHSVVHAGFRISSADELSKAAVQILETASQDSADSGAALCILLYRAIEGTLPPGIGMWNVITRADRFIGLGATDAHRLRWQVSLSFGLAQLAMRHGEFDEARRRFCQVADFDVFKWGPSLATKTTEALAMAGWLAWCADDLDDAKRCWQRGVDFGRSLLSRSLDESLINPDFPNLFGCGDGIRELTMGIENVGCCANGLHALNLRQRGISCGGDLILNSFRNIAERLGHQVQSLQVQLQRAAAIPAAPSAPVQEPRSPEEKFLALANNYFRGGDFKSCRSSLEWMIDLQPDNALLHLQSAIASFGLGDTAAAEQSVQAALKSNDRCAGILQALAQCQTFVSEKTNAQRNGHVTAHAA